MRVYLDTSCICRHLDNPSFQRIKRESDKLVQLYQHFANGTHCWATSQVVVEEITATRNPATRQLLLAQLERANIWLDVSDQAARLANVLATKGLAPMDALHVAVAYSGHCDVFLSTDDRLIRRYKRIVPPLGIPVVNPLGWVL